KIQHAALSPRTICPNVCEAEAYATLRRLTTARCGAIPSQTPTAQCRGLNAPMACLRNLSAKRLSVANALFQVAEMCCHPGSHLETRSSFDNFIYRVKMSADARVKMSATDNRRGD
ncbi:unnamed protein product, partial [Ixodes pacificus]